MMTLFFNWQVVQSKRFEDHFPRCQRTDNVSPYSPPDQNICLVFNSGLRAGSYHSTESEVCILQVSYEQFFTELYNFSVTFHSHFVIVTKCIISKVCNNRSLQVKTRL